MTIAGCGPGALELISPAVFQAARKCDVIIGPERLLKHFGDLSAADRESGTGKIERIILKGNYREMLDWIAGRYHNRSIIVMVTGDPMIHSFGKMVLERVGLGNCRIIPGISSVQYALARLGRSWEGVEIISLHGKTCSNLAEKIRKFPDLAILTDGEKTAEEVIRTISIMRLCQRHVYLCEDLSLGSETISLIKSTEDLPHKFSPLHLILVLA